MYSRIVLIILIFLLSCTEKKIKKTYYSSGKIQYKEYYTKDKVDSIEEYSEKTGKIISKLTDIKDKYRKTTYFDENHLVDISGLEIFKDGKYVRDGWWIEHNNGYTIKTEYMSVGDTLEHKNQTIIVDSLGNIKSNFSNFYTIYLPDTIEVNKKYTFIIELTTPIIGDKNLYSSALKLSDEITTDFSNYWTAKENYKIKDVGINKWEVEHKFNQKGIFYIRGCILNHTVEIKDISKDSVEITNTPNITYINKKIFVK